MVEVDIDGSDDDKKMKARQDDDGDDKINEIDDDSKNKDEKGEQNEESDEEFDSSSGSEPGGLVGLITNLSGVICLFFETFSHELLIDKFTLKTRVTKVQMLVLF